MSEYINNSMKRKMAIKNILKQLHQGKPVEELKAEFADLLKGTNAATITEVEQMLLDEGLPAEEIQNLCDLHTAVFQDGLDQQARPEATPGHPVHTFLAENQEAGKVLKDLSDAITMVKMLPLETNLRSAQMQLDKLQELDRHYVRKENLLFPYLEQYHFNGPTRVMWGIHNDIRTAWKKLALVLTAGADNQPARFKAQIDAVYGPLEKAVQEMFYKEEKILLPAALERLSETDWAAIRAQEAEIGYSFLHTVPEWSSHITAPAGISVESKPEVPATYRTATKESPRSFNLKTGSLDFKQIDLMLRTLPIDVTYVDENDTVRYFSATPGRVFQRSPAIIGRKVQECHPPQSISRVQRILDDFRAGRRDEAEFWIQMQGKFIHISYYALRDEEKNYRGTLEVTQDVTHLRALKGERRLLDDK